MFSGGASANGGGDGKGKGRGRGKRVQHPTPTAQAAPWSSGISTRTKNARKKLRINYAEEDDDNEGNDEEGEDEEDEGEEDEDEEEPCPSCSSKDAGDRIECSFCHLWFHGSCVNLLSNESHDDFLWFDNFACPTCAKKGKKSTRETGGDHLRLPSIHSSVDDVDPREQAALLWDRVVHPAPHLAAAACKNVIAVLGTREFLIKEQKTIDLIVGYLYHLMTPLGEHQMRHVFQFHAAVVMRSLVTSRLPRRVWGLEQVDRLIAVTLRHRWNVKAYLVEGAGSPGCDGVYRMSPEDAEQVPPSPAPMTRQSARAPTYEREGGGWTMTRLPNSRLQNPWYISKRPPPEQGTSKDKKAYSCQASPQIEGSRPSRTGWERLAGGLHPPPTATPVASEGFHCPQGRDQDSLEWKLAKLLADNKVFEILFETGRCEELVSKSSNIVGLWARMCFLAGMEDTLTTDKIDIMWKSGILRRKPDVQDGHQAAVFEVLANNVKEMKPELVIHLIGRLEQSVDGEIEWGRHEDVLEFLACLASDSGYGIIARDESVRLAVSQLVWSLLRDPAVLHHKSCKPVSALLAFAKGRTDEDLVSFLERCIDSWQKSADHSDSVEAVREMVENVGMKHIYQLAHLFNAGPDVSEASDTESVPYTADTEEDDGASASTAEPQEVGHFLNTLREEVCFVCAEPLLDSLVTSVDTDKFGVLSWRCSCAARGPKVHKAHAACLFGRISHQSNQRLSCHRCKSSRTFGATRDGEDAGRVKLEVHPGDL